METDAGPGCVQPDGDSAVLLAEFRTWLDRERGLSPVSVVLFQAVEGVPGRDRRVGRSAGWTRAG